MNRRLFIITAILLMTLPVWGQGFKIGYTNIDAIVFSMPGISGIKSELETYEKQLSSQVISMEKTINEKINVYQEIASTPHEGVAQERKREILRLQEELQDFRVRAEQAYTARQTDLMNPVYTKVLNAIEEVRKDKGYAMILNAQVSGSSIVLAARDEDNITEAVFAKLGVPMPRNEP